MKEEQKSFFRDLVETFVTSTIVLAVIYTFVAFPEVVYGASMEPTLHTGQRILVERITGYFNGYKRGDVVVLHPPNDNSVDYVKRLVGMPGDVVKIYNCDVYIIRDGQKYKLSELYLDVGKCTQGGTRIFEGRSVRIEDGYYMVLGDNRSRSADSRVFGFIPRDNIQGKVIVRFWPFNQVKLF